MKLQPEDTIGIYINQGVREAYVLAVVDGKALVEYEMPNGTTSLRVVPDDDPGTLSYKSISYNAIPTKWVKAMRDEGTLRSMIARPQGYRYRGARLRKIWDRIEKILEQ